MKGIDLMRIKQLFIILSVFSITLFTPISSGFAQEMSYFEEEIVEDVEDIDEVESPDLQAPSIPSVETSIESTDQVPTQPNIQTEETSVSNIIQTEYSTQKIIEVEHNEPITTERNRDTQTRTIINPQKEHHEQNVTVNPAKQSKKEVIVNTQLPTSDHNKDNHTFITDITITDKTSESKEKFTQSSLFLTSVIYLFGTAFFLLIGIGILFYFKYKNKSK